MSEATALAETPPSVKAPALYPIEVEEYDISIQPQGYPIRLIHRLRRPSDSTVYERDSNAPMETESISDDEQAIISDSSPADAAAWAKEIIEVKGYRLGSEPESAAEEWRKIERDDKGRVTGFAEKIPQDHKVTAFRGIFRATCKIDHSSAGGFVLDQDRVKVIQSFGSPEWPDFVITHTVDSPTEAIRRQYKKGQQTSLVGGSRRSRTRFKTSLKSKAEAYRASNPVIEGATKNDPSLLSAVYQAQVMDCVMRSLDAEVSD